MPRKPGKRAAPLLVIGEWEGLPVERALEILRKKGVTVLVEGELTILAKGDIQEAFSFPPRLRRRMLRTLGRLFGIDFHAFFI